MATRHTSIVVAMVVAVGVACPTRGAAQAGDVFNMGGTRNPDGSWTGLASLEFVTIGNPGNEHASALNTTHGESDAYAYGAVDCVYRIGTYEITAAQYTEFLNAVAGVDTHGLYDQLMWDNDWGCKIERFAGNGIVGDPYQYRVAPDWANRPVNHVTFWDAARFVNWLHNGQPTGAQGFGTTEDGAYIDIGNQTTFARQQDALYWIPTEDEWYKAAYYDPTLNNGDGGYWLYPTRSNSVPSNQLIDPDPGNNATFWDNGHTIDSPFYRTDVGAHENSASYYGTLDQGGNVWEWNETLFSVNNRVVRGGSFGLVIPGDLRASVRGYNVPATHWLSYLGFRVASIPEPTTWAMLCVGAGALVPFVSRRRRPRR